jgi:NADH dehydrogenase/NADH:ubiquinone oxidoreductase subunit G
MSEEETNPLQEGNQNYASYDDWKESTNPLKNSLQQVRFTYFIQEREHFEFLLRLKEDLISINAFFQAMVRLYVARDSRMMSIIEEVRATYKSKDYLKRQKKIEQIQEENRRRFTFGEEEMDELFDIIESENE